MIDAVDIEEANIAIHTYFDGDPPKEAALLGLVLVARAIGEKIDDIDVRLTETNETLAIIAKALEALARRANEL